ncbi:MAG: DSD1 family PLP-dependent enzyme [Pelomonas sp.]|nr:DSD1 family PLP-dependent enzyme [Roseateles sp.]
MPAEVTLPPLPPVARPGDPVSAIDTPTLVLELDAFERNVARLQAACDAAGVDLRPHAKAHKVPAIALAQIAAGAVGVCCQKVSEAWPFVAAGVRDIHISNEVTGARKAALLAELARHALLSTCVDHADQIATLAAALNEADARVDVLVEVNVGQDRCGVNGAEAALALVQRIAAEPRLRFAGLQAYHGRVQHMRTRAERAEVAGRAGAVAAAIKAALEARGIKVERITGGGTGSVEFDLAGGVYTEIQAGSYALMDADYQRNDWNAGWRFEQALFCASRVTSVGDGTRSVVDAGLKSLAVDTGLPTVAAAGVDYVAANDEHGILRSEAGARLPGLDELVMLVPGHVDPTLNLHDEIVAVRAGRVEAVWPVAARGLSR